MAIPLSLSDVPDATPYIQYVASGGQTVYPYPFPITQDSDLVVVLNGVAQNTDSTYSLSGQGNPTGGNVTLNSGSNAGDIVTLYRDIQIERLTQFAQNGGFSSSAFNAEFNNLYLIAQQLEASIGQCLQVPNTNNPAPTTTLQPGAYAGKYLAFDSSGNPTPAALTPAGSITAALINGFLNPPTTVEIANGLTVVNMYYPVGHVLRYGTNATPGTTNMTAALQATITAVGAGGTVIWPAGVYLASAPILAEGLNGLTIQAASGTGGAVGTTILGKHSGKAVLSLVGSNACTVGPVVLDGSTVTVPATGLLLGRSSAASSGSHNFYGTSISGNFQTAGLYNVASESNCYYGVDIGVSAASVAAVYLSGADIHSVGGLTGSSMEDNKFFGGFIGHFANTAGTAALYIDGSIASGHHHFYSTFFSKFGGDSFIYINLGAIDGAGMQFPIGFHNCSGEFAGATSPSYGLHIHNSTAINPLALYGLTATNIRFQYPTVANIFCDGASGAQSVQLTGASISTPQFATGSPTGSVFGHVDDCILVLQAEPSVSIYEATGSTISVLSGAPTITNNTGGNIIRAGGTTYTLPATTFSGNVGVTGGVNASGPVGVNGASGPAQVTGWGTPTGAAVEANFAAGSGQTMAVISAAVAKIITDLKAFGLYGA